MHLGVAVGAEFVGYLNNLAAACGEAWDKIDVCQGGSPLKFRLDVPNLAYQWAANNSEQVTHARTHARMHACTHAHSQAFPRIL